MADTTAATYSFLPWVRQGLAARADSAGGLTVKDGNVEMRICVGVNRNNLSDVPAQLYGPGDVVGIDAREVVRTEPQNSMTDFEPNYFPLVEFNHPDFPWMFTPAGAGSSGKLRPWLCLVAVRKDMATVSMNTAQPLPVLDCPVQELPDLDESWAWAHAQVARSAVVPLDQTIAQPERNLSRLLCPRRLVPSTAYYACVVPTFEVGRKAGLGESFTADDESALRPAWSKPSASGPQDRIKLPVYYQWEFSTGLAGDFESLARRLQPQKLSAEVGVNQVDVSTPGWGIPSFPASAAGAALDMEGALRNPNAQPKPWADDVRVPFQSSLLQILDTSAKPTSPSGTPSLVGPPLYGQWYPQLDRVPSGANPPHWFRELNLDPRYRIAAGLGAQVVRYQHEDLMASAWDQLAATKADNDTLKRVQLGEQVGQSMVDKHLTPLSTERFLQVTAPIHAAVLQSAAASAAANAKTTVASAGVSAKATVTAPAKGPAANLTSTADAPQFSAAFRRIARGPIAQRIAKAAAGGPSISAQKPGILPGAAVSSASAAASSPVLSIAKLPAANLSAMLSPGTQGL